MSTSIQSVLDTLALEDGAVRYTKDDTYKTKHKMITSSEWPLFRQAFPVVADALEQAHQMKINGTKMINIFLLITQQVSYSNSMTHTCPFNSIIITHIVVNH